MNRYYMMTKNPRTDDYERALWIKDYYGPGAHRVHFPSDKTSWNAAQTEFKVIPYSETRA